MRTLAVIRGIKLLSLIITVRTRARLVEGVLLTFFKWKLVLRGYCFQDSQPHT